MVESITKTLGTGSGIDTTALVNSLVEAQFAAKNAQLEQRQETLTTQLSTVSQLKSGISGFSTALSQLVSGGTLTTQATSSNTSIVRATSLNGAQITSLNADVEVRQLAAAQVAYANPVTDPAAAIGTGVLSLQFGTATVSGTTMTGFTAGASAAIDITIDETNNSLTGIRDAINAAKAGVTASIVSDSDGARLVLKGTSGAAQAFRLTATEDEAAPGLSALAIGVGSTGTKIGTAAADAIVAVDGVAVRRTTNSISDLIPGVRLDLVAASTGTTIKIGASQPTDNLRQAVNDVVTTYNELYTALREATDPISGPLRADPGARSMMQAMRELSLRQLIPADGNAPRTLAELGVATARDGSLSVNSAQLNRALTSYPEAVGRMFAAGTGGLSGALFAISTAATSRSTGLGASEQRYNRQQSDLTDQQAKATEQAEAARTRMTRQFASMDARVAAYKSTQNFLTQQIEAWNAQR
ncbi:flagellar filament capping protein FliD [Sphingomonas sp. BGYR3]|uniref:flagellar filament capping protein FliD n=1 Tax=Sphingomonas sp. BGYR3 TaxID=2975483 RepID=UPI0021A957A4|nr:flagellar filament capping protein FliD [Sphingomonas sp. BGYR3]MDG5488311.1 flagellar filament capping protein FliD [Sphingomonas sp. BGYR3]